MNEIKSAEQLQMECAFEENRQQFLDRLDQERRKECVHLFEESNAISACDCERAYIEGMRMGARLAAELLMNHT